MDPSAMYVVYRHREKHIDRRPEADKGVPSLPAEHEKLKTKQFEDDSLLGYIAV
jgi:hypothetical protein